MQYSIYTLSFYLVLPLIILRLLWRSRSNPAYRQRLKERFGWVKPRNTQRPCICLHAVSVGENIAARPLVERLLQQYPDHDLWITTTTPTGSDTVKRLYKERVKHSYLPYDTPSVLQRFLQRVQPQLLLIMETEIWPNLYRSCAQYSIPIVLVNARLSAKSFARYQHLRSLSATTLSKVSQLAARNQQDADYFQQLGLDANRIQVCGNIKFALQIPTELPAQAQHLRQQWGAQRPVIVAGSTHSGEDELLLASFQQVHQQFPQALLIIVPRHPERFAAVHQLCVASGLPVTRRSQAQAITPDTTILLGDTMGELLLWYACADIAFIGGSLVPHGGHNPLEAAAFGIPVISGQYTHNFTDIYPPLYASQGAVEVADIHALTQQLHDWLHQPTQRQHTGQNAAEFFQQQQQVLDCLLQRIRPYLNQGSHDEKCA